MPSLFWCSLGAEIYQSFGHLSPVGEQSSQRPWFTRKQHNRGQTEHPAHVTHQGPDRSPGSRRQGRPTCQPLDFYHLHPILPKQPLSTLPARRNQPRTHRLTSLPRGWQEMSCSDWIMQTHQAPMESPWLNTPDPLHGQALLQVPTPPEPGSLPFKKYNFIYLFWAVLGIHYCVWAFSSCSKQRPCSSCGVQVSHCTGFFGF